jgi:8-oxo-dGTP pyrophosphatase MutT (NUDIX family)
VSKFLFLLAFIVLSISGECRFVYTKPPEDFSPKMEATGCFCEHKGKYLFLYRHPDRPQGNTWTIPGGKLEKGESPAHAILREMQTETGILLGTAQIEYKMKVYVRYPNFDFVYHIFTARLPKKPDKIILSPREHLQYKWMTLIEALQSPLIPGERECINLAYPDLKR